MEVVLYMRPACGGVVRPLDAACPMRGSGERGRRADPGRGAAARRGSGERGWYRERIGLQMRCVRR